MAAGVGMCTLRIVTHFLAPPFDLPGGRDQRLVRHLAEDDWASAITLLRDVVSPASTPWKSLVLLAYVRFRDACDVLPDELVDASREAVQLLHRALESGAPHEQVAPFLEAVERTLDQLSRGEEALLAKLGPGDDASRLSLEELEEVSFLVDRSNPGRAAGLFSSLARRQGEAPSPLSPERGRPWRRLAVGPSRLPEAAGRRSLQGRSMRPLSGQLALEAVETALLSTPGRPSALWCQRRGGEGADFPFVGLAFSGAAVHSLPGAAGAQARALAVRMETSGQSCPKRWSSASSGAPGAGLSASLVAF